MSLRSTLEEILPDKIALPDTELYEKSNTSYFTQFSSAIKPAAIAQPTSVQDVSTLIKTLRPKLLKQEVYLAVKGTGHTPIAGNFVVPFVRNS